VAQDTAKWWAFVVTVLNLEANNNKKFIDQLINYQLLSTTEAINSSHLIQSLTDHATDNLK
jgi:hypothetical protein